jgi:hypothetical protein
MGILSTIFGSGEVIGKGMDLIDDLWETDAEVRESKTQNKINLMNAYAPFKVAQRYLAIMFGLNYILAFWVAVGLWIFNKDMQGFIDIMTAFNIGWIVTAIVMFYFGGGMAEGAISKFKGKGGN